MQFHNSTNCGIALRRASCCRGPSGVGTGCNLPFPCGDGAAGLDERREQRVVEALVPEASVDGGQPLPRHRRAIVAAVLVHFEQEDIAKQIFLVHAANAEGRRVAQVRLRRAQVLDYFRELSPCRVGMEGCATAHHRARELIALGHEVKLMPPAYAPCEAQQNRRSRCGGDRRGFHTALGLFLVIAVPVRAKEAEPARILLAPGKKPNRPVTALTFAEGGLPGTLSPFGLPDAPQSSPFFNRLAAALLPLGCAAST
ncbi:hypothetical protein BMIN10S_00700 [Bosea minatitlanensis]